MERMTAQPPNRFVFCVVVVEFAVNGNQALGERTYNSDNKNIYHPKFVWYLERSSLADINSKSYHLIAFELINPLLYIYFPSFKYRIFLKSLKSTLPSSVAL